MLKSREITINNRIKLIKAVQVKIYTKRMIKTRLYLSGQRENTE